MNDPIRLLDARDETFHDERELLAEARNLQPPVGAREKIWAAMGPYLGPGTGGGGGDGGSSGNAATNAATHGSSGVGSSAVGSSGTSITGSIGGIKAVVAGIVAGPTVAGVIAAVVAASSPPPVQPLVAPLPRVEATVSAVQDKPIVEHAHDEPQIEEVVAAPVVPPEALPRQTVPPSVSVAKPARVNPPVAEATPTENTEKQERASRLRDENVLLGDARLALRSGDPTSALAKLDAASGRFPDGMLAQEREVLVIEALAKSGQRAAASARAAAFVQTYPTSPHAMKVRGFIQ